MPFSHGYRPYHPLREILVRGVLIGLTGGLAEVAFLGIYLSLNGSEPTAVAEAFARAVHLGAMASTGIAVHMLLSLLLGIALMSVWLTVRGPRPGAASVYVFMTAALIVVWSFSFLVLLPTLAPAMPALLPYSVTFASKLVFAFAGAPVLQHAASTQKPSFARSIAPSPWTRF
jgi:hypothetical protein